MEEQELKNYVLLDLKEKQSWDLDKKIDYAKEKIIEFVEYCGGVDNVFVSFSGGKDSCVFTTLGSLYLSRGWRSVL